MTSSTNTSKKLNLPIEAQYLLIAFGRITNLSHKPHYSERAIRSYLPKQVSKSGTLFKKIRKKAYRKLLSEGLIIKHPTSGDVTYSLTPRGVHLASQLLEELTLRKRPSNSD